MAFSGTFIAVYLVGHGRAHEWKMTYLAISVCDPMSRAKLGDPVTGARVPCLVAPFSSKIFWMMDLFS